METKLMETIEKLMHIMVFSFFKHQTNNIVKFIGNAENQQNTQNFDQKECIQL